MKKNVACVAAARRPEDTIQCFPDARFASVRAHYLGRGKRSRAWGGPCTIAFTCAVSDLTLSLEEIHKD